jgi:hypothetical protein
MFGVSLFFSLFFSLFVSLRQFYIHEYWNASLSKPLIRLLIADRRSFNQISD